MGGLYDVPKRGERETQSVEMPANIFLFFAGGCGLP